MVPSSDTITGWNVFTAHTKIKSSEVNANFNQFRGHLIPFDASITGAANNTYDLGSTNYYWRKLYATQIAATSMNINSISCNKFDVTTITAVSVVATGIVGTSITGTTITATNLFIGATPAPVRSGTYTPTPTKITNCDTITVYPVGYSQVGALVTCQFRVDIDPTVGATTTVFSLSLPVATTMVLTGDAGGTFVCDIAGGGIPYTAGFVYSGGTVVNCALTPDSSGSNRGYWGSFTYQVK